MSDAEAGQIDGPVGVIRRGRARRGLPTDDARGSRRESGSSRRHHRRRPQRRRRRRGRRDVKVARCQRDGAPPYVAEADVTSDALAAEPAAAHHTRRRRRRRRARRQPRAAGRRQRGCGDGSAGLRRGDERNHHPVADRGGAGWRGPSHTGQHHRRTAADGHRYTCSVPRRLANIVRRNP